MAKPQRRDSGKRWHGGQQSLGGKEDGDNNGGPSPPAPAPVPTQIHVERQSSHLRRLHPEWNQL